MDEQNQHRPYAPPTGRIGGATNQDRMAAALERIAASLERIERKMAEPVAPRFDSGGGKGPIACALR